MGFQHLAALSEGRKKSFNLIGQSDEALKHSPVAISFFLNLRRGYMVYTIPYCVYLHNLHVTRSSYVHMAGTQNAVCCPGCV